MGSVETLPDIGIPDVACYLPERVVTVEEWGQRTGQTTRRIDALIANGVRCFHDALSQSPMDMGVKAVRLLLTKAHIAPRSVDLLIYTHTVQGSIAPPPASTAGFIQASCGLQNALSFSIAQQNCVSPMLAIRIARQMMARQPHIRRAIVVSVDLMGTAADGIRGILDLSLHSDGACAFLVERDAPCNRVLGYHFFTDGRFFRGTDENHELVPDEKYHWSCFATMRSALQQAGLRAQDLSRILPNHVNMEGWRLVLSMLRLPPERLYTANFSRLGHVFGCDPFINFLHERKEAGGHYLLFSSGLAGCFGALVVKH
ncbi:MAG TPA: 3-oxoacyl-[acyl-carrier-protein] synthase III C-terminal domain-containing protein [Burkholderiaceae bacterium]|nr:3-oxoacyl-[acyl-carrier-protein] synthase III C-terminal domain-containing protein [Burkholderiaceae bacterium]